MADFDAIRWLRLTDDDVVRLPSAVGEVMATQPEVIAGSSARRQAARDIDIGLVVDRAAMLTVDVDGIAEQIAKQRGRSLDEFDVRVVHEADPVFLGNLMREGHRCYERDFELRVAFEVQAMSMWLDFQPAWDRMRKRVLEVWSRG